MSKKRASTLAKELGISGTQFIKKCKALGIEVKNPGSLVEEKTANIVRRKLAKAKRKPIAKKKKAKVKIKKASAKKVKPKKRAVKKKKPEEKLITLKGLPTVKKLATKFGLQPRELTARLAELGLKAIQTTTLDEDTAHIIAHEFGYEIEFQEKPPEKSAKEQAVAVEEKKAEVIPEVEVKLVPRPPVVTLMGHVDHGKTSILDVVRRTNVVATESGGITQHIGAYKVNVGNQSIIFLDTPGHEAFTSMRRRGANVTDIVVLVVAADDGIMPQTIEAIDHARNAGVPIVIAINKIDKSNISIDKVKRQLTERNLTTEDWGGDTLYCEVSAVTKQGIEHLLETILLQAEMLELKTNPEVPAKGVVVEAKLEQGRGAVATVLIKDGILRVGDYVIAGLYHGKIKAIMDEHGRHLEQADPSMPVEILGLSGVPYAGSKLEAVLNEKEAREICEKRQEKLRQESLAPSRTASLEDFFGKPVEEEKKELTIIIKGDVQGSVEALSKYLEKLSTEKVSLKIIHSNVGDVNDSDVMLAAATDAIIIGFHTKVDPQVSESAKHENVQIYLYDVIYKAIDEIKKAMEGLLEPKITEVFLGEAEIRQLFASSTFGTIAGCYVTNGRVVRNANAHLIRNNEVLWEGEIISLRRYKEEVKEVKSGLECGLRLKDFDKIEVGDIIQVYKLEKVAQTL